MGAYDKGVRNGVYITLKLMLAFGLKDYLAVGFAGCWMAESCCNPGAYNKAEKSGSFKGSTANGSGYGAGLAQWSNAWKKLILKQFNRNTPIETWTMDQLLEIVTKGCTDSFINMLRKCTSASLSTDIILRGYENGSAGKGTKLRSLQSMKAYTWCKTSYIPDVGRKTFPDGYIGALSERTAWANKILKAMGSGAYSDLSSIGGMSFNEGGSEGSMAMSGSGFGESNTYPTHSEYETYTGTGGNIFSSAGENAFATAAMKDNSLTNSTGTGKHTRIYSTNDSCIVLDELALPMDSSLYTYANQNVTKEDVKQKEQDNKTLNKTDTSTNKT